MQAVVLSGGGSKGAWQAGALGHLLGERGVRPDLLCGVSVGALNAAYLAMFPVGEEAAAAEGLLDIWRGITTRRVRRAHLPLGPLHGLWRPHLYDSRPLQALVRRQLDPARIRASGRKLRVGTVALSDGTYRLFDERSPDIVDAVLASAAFPAMLEPIEIEGSLHIDGGLRDVTPLAAAIEAGATSVVVLLARPRRFRTGPLFEHGRPNAIRMASHALEILFHEVVENDLLVALRTNELVRRGGAAGKRYVEVRVVRPARPLAVSPLDFHPRRVAALIQQGAEDARAAALGTEEASPGT